MLEWEKGCVCESSCVSVSIYNDSQRVSTALRSAEDGIDHGSLLSAVKHWMDRKPFLIMCLQETKALESIKT